MTKLIVVGGGLAGLYAAYSASSHGMDVELYEKSKIGSHHNCGEMFTEIYTTAPSECILNRINEFLFKVDDEIILYKFGENSPFIMTNKDVHEIVMKEKCLKNGVCIHEGVRYNFEKQLEKRDKIIDASGSHTSLSAYDISMGKAFCYIVKSNNNYTANFTVINKNCVPCGYYWNFPKGRNMSNIGYGVYDKSIDTKYIDSEFKNKFLISSNIVNFGGGTLPMPTMKEYYHNLDTSDINRLKVGNAFGLVNPLMGGGEHLAVISGMLAGELCAKDREIDYGIALDEIIGDEMRFGISMYEFLKKQDIESLKTVMKSWQNEISFEVINKTVRKAMAKWMTLPDTKESELDEFINQT